MNRNGNGGSKDLTERPESVAGIKGCACGCGHWALVRCAAYPKGLYIKSKDQGSIMLAALHRTTKASVDEQRRIDADLLNVNLPKELEGDAGLRAEAAVEPQRALDMAATKGERAARVASHIEGFEKFRQIMTPAMDPEAIEAAERELRMRVAREPAADIFRATETHEKVVMVVDRNWHAPIFYLETRAMESVRGMVMSEDLRPDDFAVVADVVKAAKLPEKRREGVMPTVTAFRSKSGDGLARIVIPVDGEIVEQFTNYYDVAVGILKEATSEGLLRFEDFNDHHEKILGAGLKPETKETEEVVEVGNFQGIIRRKGDDVLDTELRHTGATIMMGPNGITVERGLPAGMENMLEQIFGGSLADPSR